MQIASLLVSVAAAFGLGGALGAWLTAVFQRRNEVAQREHELKRSRYLCILILMLSKLDPQHGISRVKAHRPDLQTADDLDHELTTELLNAVVFASNQVLSNLSAFLQRPSLATFTEAAIAMRIDLWNGRKVPANDIAKLLQVATSATPKNSGAAVASS